MSDSEKCNTCGRPLRSVTTEQLYNARDLVDFCYGPQGDLCRVLTTVGSLAAALESMLTVFDPREPMSAIQQMKIRTARAVLEHYPRYIKLHTPVEPKQHGAHAARTDGDTEKETQQPSSAGGQVDNSGPKTGDLPP